MTDASKEEQRALSREELDLVSRARQPGLAEMSDRELGDLVGLLRVRRDRARGVAERQRREMRGKAAPRGAQPSRDNRGTRDKEHFLGAALGRALEEQERRKGGQEESQHDIAERALAMRREAEEHAPERPENTPEPDEGFQPTSIPEPDPTVQQEAYPEIVHKSRTPRG
jgi:hypothetical protein